LPSYEHITLAPRNHKIYKFNEKLLALEYIREIPLGIYETKIAVNSRHHHFKDPDYHRLILFDGTQQISSDLKVPYGDLKFALKGNSILVKLINPDFEEDFIRYGIFELIKEGLLIYSS